MKVLVVDVFGTHLKILEGLSAQQSDAEFNAQLDKSIQSIFDASNT